MIQSPQTLATDGTVILLVTPRTAWFHILHVIVCPCRLTHLPKAKLVLWTQNNLLLSEDAHLIFLLQASFRGT